MLPLGTKLPDFALPDVVSGRVICPTDFEGCQALWVMFICRHCPYVIHVQNEIARIARDYRGASLGVVAISANDAQAYPQDAPSELAAMAHSLGFEFPFCYDETQAVAKAFTAACTPDFFLFDEQRALYYRGQLDQSRPHNGLVVDGADMRAALDAVLSGKPPPAAQWPSIGCNIKWKPGEAPPYYG